jgi:hypothetical protein
MQESQTETLTWAIVDKRAPEIGRENLRKLFDKVFEFSSEGITYDELSGHPDIFIFQKQEKLIIAKNSPKKFVEFLKKMHINFVFGATKISKDLKSSTQYNCLINDNLLFHKKNYSDKSILNSLNNIEIIELPQPFTRCSMLGFGKKNFITSDLGILKIMKKNKFNVKYFSPEKIILDGYEHGLFGGCTGVFDNKIYLMGSLNYHEDGEKIKQFIKDLNFEIVELYDGPLFDVGSIFIGNSSVRL